MPINLPVPQDVQPQSLYQLLADILRRATDGTVVLPVGGELMYAPTNASTSGRKYRIQIIEVTDPDTQQIQAVIQVVPA